MLQNSSIKRRKTFYLFYDSEIFKNYICFQSKGFLIRMLTLLFFLFSGKFLK